MHIGTYVLLGQVREVYYYPQRPFLGKQRQVRAANPRWAVRKAKVALGQLIKIQTGLIAGLIQ